VHAHGGGIIKVNKTFYWYGTSQKKEPGWISDGIKLYSSKDLFGWTSLGVILAACQIQGMPFPPPYRIERPKANTFISAIAGHKSICIKSKPWLS
jgi:beta-galactosidase